MNELGKVLDPTELDSAEGRRGRVEITVPNEWLAGGAEIELVAPKRIPCARCDGGGCESCARSGAIRLADEPEARTLRARLPSGSRKAFALRIPNPFGANANVAQLIVELRSGEAASPGVTCIEAPEPIDDAASDDDDDAHGDADSASDAWIRGTALTLALAALVAIALAAVSR